MALAQWFQGPVRMAPRNKNRDIPTHYFFDPSPGVKFETAELTYLLTTTQGSRYGYEVDGVSGQLFRRFDYCPQRDISGRVWGVSTPPFHQGIVPRVLNQLGRPQEIIVFGHHERLSSYSPSSPLLLRTRIVGGLLVEYCDKTICFHDDEWIPEIVLVGVVPYDSRFQHIEDLDSLKRQVRWNQVIPFLENRKGRSHTPTKDHLSYRVRQEIIGPRALELAFKKGHLFRFEQMKSMQRFCHQLYDYTWARFEIFQNKAAGKPHTSPRLEAGLERAYRLFSEKHQGLEQSLRDERDWERSARDVDDVQILEWLQSDNFGMFMRGFLLRYGSSYRTCMQYVRSSNYQLEPQRHWTLAQLEAFLSLERVGMIYDCTGRSWTRFIVSSDEDPHYEYRNNIRNCNSAHFNAAIKEAPQMAKTLLMDNRPFPHYIRYDMGVGGSHQALFSWNISNGKTMRCESGGARNPLSDFPTDIYWINL